MLLLINITSDCNALTVSFIALIILEKATFLHKQHPVFGWSLKEFLATIRKSNMMVEKTV